MIFASSIENSAGVFGNLVETTEVLESVEYPELSVEGLELPALVLESSLLTDGDWLMKSNVFKNSIDDTICVGEKIVFENCVELNLRFI